MDRDSRSRKLARYEARLASEQARENIACARSLFNVGNYTMARQALEGARELRHEALAARCRSLGLREPSRSERRSFGYERSARYMEARSELRR